MLSLGSVSSAITSDITTLGYSTIGANTTFQGTGVIIPVGVQTVYQVPLPVPGNGTSTIKIEGKINGVGSTTASPSVAAFYSWCYNDFVTVSSEGVASDPTVFDIFLEDETLGLNLTPVTVNGTATSPPYYSILADTTTSSATVSCVLEFIVSTGGTVNSIVV